MRSKAMNYITSASYPEPESTEINGEYPVRVVVGEAGYTDRHNRFVAF